MTMPRMNRLSAALVAALLSLPATMVVADDQTSAPGEETAQQLDAVTVTARRRSESIQEVPVAVSAFNGEELKDMQAKNIDGLQGSVPNLNIVQGRGSSSSVNVFIRGIGQPDALQTFDPGVGMYVDDVYFSRIQGALFGLHDVERVEVLRGPQGTLYGKNSTGGAIKLVTRRPLGGTPEADVEFTAGNYGRFEGRFYGALPFSETAGASIALASSVNDGYVRDPATSKRYNDEDTRAIRLKFSGDPSDRLSWDFSLDYTRQDNGLTLGEPMAPLIRTDLQTQTIVPLLIPDGSEYDYRTRTSFAPDQGQELKHWGARFGFDVDIGDRWMFRSITSYRELESDSFIDIDASQFELGDVLVAFDQDQTSQEFQFQYDNGSNLQGVFGLYYLKENVPSYQEAYADDLFAYGGTAVDFLRTINDDLSTTSYAAFAHGSWEFAPSWTLSAGIRYTSEEKDYWRTTSTFWDSEALYELPALGIALPFSALNETVAFEGRKTWNAWTPSISLEKAFSDQMMGYVSANRGFKSGGFNGRANSQLETTAAIFDPEYVWTYEIGLKMNSADRRLQGNLAAFHSDYKDFQARVSEVLNPDSPTPTFSFPVLNAASMTIKGIEFEGVALVGSGTRLSAQIGWMDAKYDEFADLRTTDPANPAYDPRLHAHVPFSPDWTARLAASHTFYAASGAAFTLGADVSYRGETWLSVDNRDVLSQDAYTVAGLFGVYDSADSKWQVRAGVRNLTDEVYRIDGQEFSSVGNIQTAYYGWPRHYYASVRYSFY
jgi:iron complex outermembrane receptor protein